MKEFVFGTAAQYAALDNELLQGHYYEYPNRQLPHFCSPSTACFWFGMVDGDYCVCVSKGVTANTANEELREFFRTGEKRFAHMKELIAFMHSLQPLFTDKADTVPDADRTSATEEKEIVDKARVMEIKAENEKVKLVWPEELSSPLKSKIFGQDEVIDELVDKIVINRMRKQNRLLTVALIGPTATGKSETARALTEIMTAAYGTDYGFIEIAGSEFIGEHMVHRFFGSPPGYVGHGQPTVLEPVRNNPHHIIVINEIEKANEKLIVGLMEAIDTGKLGMADNSTPIDLNGCIMLFTSNIPIDMEAYGRASAFERAEIGRDAFTKHCGRPEISGKIGNFLVFNPLSDSAITDIIVKFASEELNNYDLTLWRIDEHLMAELLNYRTKYGARGIRDLIGNSIGKYLLKNRCLGGMGGKRVVIKGTTDSIEIEFI